MILGMPTFTFIHVLLSLIGIAAGFVVALGLLTGQRLAGWTLLFLATTILTSATGFGFPFTGLKPSYLVGLVSLIILAIAVYALYARKLERTWRAIYVVTALAALYLNVFVLIAQAFAKIPTLKELAPTQSEPPFLISELVLLIIFIGLGVVSTRRFYPAAA
jgi:uncharacterized membrane protein